MGKRETFGNGNNRRLVRDGDSIGYVLHDTEIVRVTPNKDGAWVTVDCGGYVTATTTKAINEAFDNAGFPFLRANRRRGILEISCGYCQGVVASVDERTPGVTFGIVGRAHGF